MPKYDEIKLKNLKKITKGKIGEWVARDYYRSKNNIVWFLEYYNMNYHFYSGTGREYINENLILTPWEKAILSNTRAFDLLVIPKEEVDKAKYLAKKYDYSYIYYKDIQRIFMSIINKNNLRLDNFINFIEFEYKLDDFIEYDLSDCDIKYIKSYWIKSKKYWEELKKLKRVLVDVKTKWSEYDYPNHNKKKDTKLIKLLKHLGFECEVLELDFSNIRRIKVSSFKL